MGQERAVVESKGVVYKDVMSDRPVRRDESHL